MAGEVVDGAREEGRRGHVSGDQQLPEAAGDELVFERLAVDAHLEQSRDEVVLERRRLPRGDDLPALGVQVLVLALGRLRVAMGLRVLEALAARVQLPPELARQVEEIGEDEPGVRRAEGGDELAPAGGQERLEQLRRQRAHSRLERRQPLLGEHAVERPAVAGVLRRVEVERRPPARHRVLRDDDSLRAREVGRPGARRDDVVVARERPEVPARAARHRALRPEPGPHGVRIAREVLRERVEVGGHARRRAGTLSVPHSGQPVIVTSPASSIADVRASSSSSVTRSISVARGAPAQR